MCPVNTMMNKGRQVRSRVLMVEPLLDVLGRLGLCTSMGSLGMIEDVPFRAFSYHAILRSHAYVNYKTHSYHLMLPNLYLHALKSVFLPKQGINLPLAPVSSQQGLNLALASSCV